MPDLQQLLHALRAILRKQGDDLVAVNGPAKNMEMDP